MLLQTHGDKLHFAVIGQLRTGKTTFIDAMRNLTIEGPEQESCSPQKLEANHRILDDKVLFIEIQTGLDKPKDQAYHVSRAIQNIDEYILVIDDRTETSWVQDQMYECEKPPVIVRSKVEINILNNKLAGQNTVTDTEFSKHLKETLKENLDVQCSIFCIDSYFQAKFEFLDLAKHLLRNVLSMHEMLIPRKKGVLEIKVVFSSNHLPYNRENGNRAEVQQSDDSKEMVTCPEMIYLQGRDDIVPGRVRKNVRSC